MSTIRFHDESRNFVYRGNTFKFVLRLEIFVNTMAIYWDCEHIPGQSINIDQFKHPIFHKPSSINRFQDFDRAIDTYSQSEELICQYIVRDCWRTISKCFGKLASGQAVSLDGGALNEKIERIVILTKGDHLDTIPPIEAADGNYL